MWSYHFQIADSKCIATYEKIKDIKVLSIINVTDQKYSFPIGLTKELHDEVAELIGKELKNATS